ncbi:MAG: protein phosphatase 2C domain-containing protein [Chloroflexi bacterium]|nr:protein phosphatase 2C domain-containing protein [Chloroflexota bacterium]
MPEHPAPSALDIGTATDVGRVREANEDSFFAVRCTGVRAGEALVAVADGMGGHKAGEVASALAIQALQRMLDQSEPTLEADSLLVRALELGNGAIWDAAAADFEKEGMGTTIVAALLTADGRVVLANVGDSRGYAFAGGQARLVTVDHTWVNQQVLAGEMTAREALVSPFRNLLTRSLGSAPEVEIDLFKDLHLEVGDALVLVSDGVTGYLEERDFSAILGESADAQVAAERLVAEAVQRGGADNATAVVVRRR